MNSYLEGSPWDWGAAAAEGQRRGTLSRANREAKGYLADGDYEGAAKAMLPYDMDAAQGYLSYGNEAEQYSDRRKDKQYARDLAPFVAKNDWAGAKDYALTQDRGADDLLKLEEFATKASDREKQAMADKLDLASSGLYAASQFAESGDMDGYNRSIEALAGQGFDVKDFQGQPYNPSRLNAELVKSKKGLEILGVIQAERKAGLDERRVGAMETTAQAALARANRPDKVDEGVGGSGYSKEQLGAANTYRDDYNKATKDFQVLADTIRRSETYYQRAYAGQPSGQGDIGLVYALAKAYDPTSVVREGEFNTMNASSGVKNKLMGLYTKAAGEGFSPEVRTEIMRELRSQYTAQKSLYDKTRDTYVDLAKTINVDPKMVAMDYSAGVPQAPGRPTDLPNATQNKGVTATDPETGETWYSDGRSWQRKR